MNYNDIIGKSLN